MRNKSLFVISFVLLASLVLSACAGIAAAQGATPTAPAGSATTRTVSVTGSGKAYLTPDIAYINIGVHEEGKEASQAVASNNTQTAKVADAIKKLGIDPKDIQTTNFSIYPQQGYDSQGKPTGEVTYVVDNTVFVTVRKLDNLGALLDGAIAAGANSINGIQFDVADKTSALSEARKAAITDAKSQATELAQEAGLSLGPIQSISVGGGAVPLPVFQGKGGGFAADAASVPVSPGQMIVSVDVNIVYEIH